MITRHLTFLIIASGLFGCGKNTGISDCPINYQIDYTNTYTIRQTWKLIGFNSEGSSFIDYPPCEGYDFYSQLNSDFEITISFIDTFHNSSDTEAYIYPYLFVGKAPINTYGSTYDIDSSNNIATGRIITTHKGGPKKLGDYESKYYNALENANRFVIQNNQLTIYYSPTDRLLYVSD